jgi:Leucine-rich repeat (LRR) protein
MKLYIGIPFLVSMLIAGCTIFNIDSAELDKLKNGMADYLTLDGFIQLDSLPLEKLDSIRGLDLTQVKNYGVFFDTAFVRKLTNLEAIDCSGLGLARLPESFTELKKIKRMDLSSNPGIDLEGAIETMEAMPDLQYLYLDSCSINEIPKELAEFQQLKYLWVGGNQLETIPKEMLDMSQLEVVNLANNHLQQIPLEFLSRLPKLKSVYLSANPDLDVEDYLQLADVKFKSKLMELEVGNEDFTEEERKRLYKALKKKARYLTIL